MFKINTTPALIGINTIPGKLEIQQPSAEINIHTEHPRVEITSDQPRVIIDQSQCFSEAGLKSPKEIIKEGAELGQQATMAGIARIVGQGNELSSIETGADAIAIQAEENAFELFHKEFNIALMPKSRPKIDVIEGQVNIQVHEGKVNQDVKINKPIINYTRGKVEIYLRQKNSIDIQYVGSKIDKQI